MTPAGGANQATRAPLDPKLSAMLAKLADLPDLSTLPVAEVRSGFKWRNPDGLRIDAVARVEDLPPNDRLPIALRLYRPQGEPPFPVLVFFHGSGFVACDLDTHDPMCRNLCAGSGYLVVSVDYRLSPEHKFPAAIDDALAATRWVEERAGDFGGDPARIVVGGDSAGGNLGAVTALRARDDRRPRLAGQLLIYPVTDHYSARHASYAQNAVGCGLTADTMRWFWDHYLNDPSEAPRQEASPLRAVDLSGLPPAMVLTAEYDVLRDEGRQYAERLAAAGVDVVWSHSRCLHHGFLFFPGVIDGVSEALDEACAWLRSLARPGRPTG